MNIEGRKFRHEFKYYINYSDYLAVKSRVKHVLKPDPNGDEKGEYFIRSLYFDDIYDSALFEKNFGVNIRRKYRIRIYNYSNSTIKLERKSKVNQYVCKESDKLTLEEYYSALNNNLPVINTDNEVRKDFFIAVKSKLLRPKVIVDYDREAFISNISDIRVTFDKDLRVAYSSNDIFNKNIATQNIIPLPTMIMEVKYNEFLPDSIRDMLRVEARDLSAISKYVFCRVQKNNI